MVTSYTRKQYLVGGAVRDALLGLEVTDRDWVVVGSTLEEMAEQGFRPVGKTFPVFLHPKTQEEYALARTERKVAVGYKGFDVFADKSVTLEQDLSRRDLTVNAIAQDKKGQLIDPYGGLDDINSKTLRHVSPAFREDPLRVLRVARFAARFAPLGFTIAAETKSLLAQMVASGELDALTIERVWQEVEPALSSERPSVFFEVLKDCGALKVLFPEVDRLYGIPQRADYHPEIDCGVHTMMVVDRARELTVSSVVIFAALTHDLGKALTPKSEWPNHRMHEKRGVEPVEALCKRYRLSKKYQLLAVSVCRDHLLMHTLAQLRPDTILKLLQRLDAFRRPEQLEEFSLCCQADAQGRGGDFPNKPYAQSALLHDYFTAVKSVNSGQIASETENPQDISAAIFTARSRAIGKLRPKTHQD